MPYAQVPHAEKHGVRIGLDISAVVFVIHLTKIKVKKIHPWVLWLEAYIPIMGWLTYQYYMTGAYKNKTKTNRGRYFAKKPKNAQGGINSAQAKFPESPKNSVFTP